MISRFMPARCSTQTRTQFQHHKFQHPIPTATRVVPHAANLVQQLGRQVGQFSKLAHAVSGICKRTNPVLHHSNFIPRVPNSFTTSGSVTKHVGAMPVGNAPKRTLATLTKLKLAHVVSGICKRTNSFLHSKFIPSVLRNSFTTSRSVTKHADAMPVGNAPKRTLATPTKGETKLASNRALGKELIEAAKNGHIDIDTIRRLIKDGADPNAKNDHGDTALMLAALYGHTNTVKLLIKKGAKVNAKNNDGDTALMAGMHDRYIVNLLIKKGAKVNAKNNGGHTALMAGMHNRYIVNLLIEKGAKVNAKNNDGKTALILAAENGDIDAVKFLIENGATK